MKNIKLISIGSLITALFVISVLVFAKGSANAQALVNTDENKPPESSQSSNQAPTAYTYVAQPGDSYTLMARKAIQTYGITNKVNLSQAQIIFAETNLTKEAGSPTLLLGQKVEINQDTVKNWVNKAKDLSAEQQSAWNVYAKNANFNTNKVGQAS